MSLMPSVSRCRRAVRAALVSSFLSVVSFAAAAGAPDWLDAEVASSTKDMIALRHELHANPELGNQEFKTQERIARLLQEAGIEVVKGMKNAPTAVIGILNPDKGETIALRADIDALPIKENTGLSYASKAKGTYWGREGVDVSHMCGHDAHVAMLVAAAQIMARHRDEINRRVVFVFQPAEEGDSIENPFLAASPRVSGAKALVTAGLTEKYDIKHYFGIHVMARLAAGKMLVAKGAALNSADAFEIHIRGEQAHGAMPWTGVDATLAAAQTVVALQQIVSRNVNLTEGMGVITVGKLASGETGNVMSGSASMTGTIRSNHPDIRAKLLERIPVVAKNTAAAAGAAADVKLLEIYPVTWNNPELAEDVVGQLKSFGIDASVSSWNPGASEDFSFFAQKAPSVFMFLGVDKPGLENAPNNHSDRFTIDDSALPAGVRAHIAAVLMPQKDAAQ